MKIKSELHIVLTKLFKEWLYIMEYNEEEAESMVPCAEDFFHYLETNKIDLKEISHTIMQEYYTYKLKTSGLPETDRIYFKTFNYLHKLQMSLNAFQRFLRGDTLQDLLQSEEIST